MDILTCEKFGRVLHVGLFGNWGCSLLMFRDFYDLPMDQYSSRYEWPVPPLMNYIRLGGRAKEIYSVWWISGTLTRIDKPAGYELWIGVFEFHYIIATVSRMSLTTEASAMDLSTTRHSKVHQFKHNFRYNLCQPNRYHHDTDLSPVAQLDARLSQQILPFATEVFSKTEGTHRFNEHLKATSFQRAHEWSVTARYSQSYAPSF